MVFDGPEGCRLALGVGDAGLREIRFEGIPPEGGERDDGDAVLRETARQLARYFAGELKEFDLPLDLRGTEFQKRVWCELRAIPYGETRAYGDIAKAIGAPKAVRAVGAANGQNPIPIVVPCHRVIGASGRLVGFGGGLEMKRLLLKLEQLNYGFWA
jgi:methylated-DNA-[protein]-cysteine S-methyltransferase